MGAAFAMGEGNISGFIQGEQGVYKLKLLKVNEAETLGDYDEFTKEYLKKASSSLLENVFQALESSADIDDNRACLLYTSDAADE